MEVNEKWLVNIPFLHNHPIQGGFESGTTSEYALKISSLGT